MNNIYILRVFLCVNTFVLCMFTSFSQEARCSYEDMSEDEAKLLPWYGNSEFFLQYSKSLQKEGIYFNNYIKEAGLLETYYDIPVQFWIYDSTNVNSLNPDNDYPTQATIVNYITTLNEAFIENAIPIRFHLLCDIRNIYKTDNVEMKRAGCVNTGFINNVSGAMNVHIIRNITTKDVGAFTYCTPYIYSTTTSFIFLEYITNPQTFVHEVGHYFGLQHTFASTEHQTYCKREMVSRNPQSISCLTPPSTNISHCSMSGDF